MIQSLLLLFMATMLGAGTIVVAMVEDLADRPHLLLGQARRHILYDPIRCPHSFTVVSRFRLSLEVSRGHLPKNVTHRVADRLTMGGG